MRTTLLTLTSLVLIILFSSLTIALILTSEEQEVLTKRGNIISKKLSLSPTYFGYSPTPEKDDRGRNIISLFSDEEVTKASERIGRLEGKQKPFISARKDLFGNIIINLEFDVTKIDEGGKAYDEFKRIYPKTETLTHIEIDKSIVEDKDFEGVNYKDGHFTINYAGDSKFKELRIPFGYNTKIKSTKTGLSGTIWDIYPVASQVTVEGKGVKTKDNKKVISLGEGITPKDAIAATSFLYDQKDRNAIYDQLTSKLADDKRGFLHKTIIEGQDGKEDARYKDVKPMKSIHFTKSKEGTSVIINTGVAIPNKVLGNLKGNFIAITNENKNNEVVISPLITGEGASITKDVSLTTLKNQNQKNSIKDFLKRVFLGLSKKSK